MLCYSVKIYSLDKTLNLYTRFVIVFFFLVQIICILLCIYCPFVFSFLLNVGQNLQSTVIYWLYQERRVHEIFVQYLLGILFFRIRRTVVDVLLKRKNVLFS